MSAVFWGISATLGRAAFTGGYCPDQNPQVGPLVLSQARTTFSFLAVLLFLLPTRGGQRRLRLLSPILAGSLPRPRGRGRSNYFYYRRHPADECRHRHHRAIHRAGLGAGLHGRPRPRKATVPKMTAVALAIAGIALVIGLFGGFSGNAACIRCLGVTAALVAAFSFAYYNIAGHSSSPATTTGLCSCFTSPSRPRCSGSSSIRPRKSLPPTTRSATWMFLFVFSWSQYCFRLRSTLLACSA